MFQLQAAITVHHMINCNPKATFYIRKGQFLYSCASSFNINAALYHGISVFLHCVYSPAAQSSVLVPPVSHCMNSRQAHCLAH